jgi:cyclase
MTMMEQVTENIFTETTIRGCNPSYLITSDGAVIVDTPQLPTYAVKMREEVEAKCPIRYIVNTEHHVDHIFGNYYFNGAGKVVAHVGVWNEFMKVGGGIDPYDYAKEAIPTDDPEGESIFPDKETYYKNYNRPAVTFDKNMTIHMGSHTLELMHTPGHTPGQVCVYVPEERVVFSGDTIFNQCQTWLYASDVTLWLTALDILSELDVDYIIPGHGPVCTKREINTQRALLHEWMSIVAGGVAKGLSKEECLGTLEAVKNRMPVDIGQEYMIDFVIKNNTYALYDKLAV